MSGKSLLVVLFVLIVNSCVQWAPGLSFLLSNYLCQISRFFNSHTPSFFQLVPKVHSPGFDRKWESSKLLSQISIWPFHDFDLIESIQKTPSNAGNSSLPPLVAQKCCTLLHQLKNNLQCRYRLSTRKRMFSPRARRFSQGFPEALGAPDGRVSFHCSYSFAQITRLDL